MSEVALRKGIQKARGNLPVGMPEERYRKVFDYMSSRLASIWAGDNLMSYPEAVARLTMDKSPGFPFYYDCIDKADALLNYGNVVQSQVESVIAGAEMWMPATLTLKDELRTRDRVAQEKTRVFAAGGLTNLITSKMLFDIQNDKLRRHLGEHPLTIGIPVPGPYFVKTVLSVSDEQNVTEGDIDGCDLRYPLQVARMVRDLRKTRLPEGVHSAVDLTYDEDFCGYVIVCGCVYLMYGNKSGRNNTGDDNGFMLWIGAADYVLATTNCEVNEIDSFFEALFNGDDNVTSWWGGLSATGWRKHMRETFGVIVELGSEDPVTAREINFLSHHLRERFVPGLGDIIVAAGNRTKLLSSIQWLRRNNTMTLEENALAHLLGVRIMLWPWRQDFVETEEIIDDYLARIERTPQINALLKARIPESKIIELHTRFEGKVSYFSGPSGNIIDDVPDSIISVIRSVGGQMATLNAKELARRKAQSVRDKKQAKAKPAKKFTPEVNKGMKREKKTVAPMAVGYDTTSKFSKKYGGRFKDMITIEGDDHLEFVISPGSPTDNQVGQVLNEIYISPSEFGGTRLEKYAALYEKYRFTKLEFEYVPSAGSTDRGDIILAYDRDISDPTPPPTEQGLRQFTGFEGNVDGNIWTRKVCKAKLQCPEEGYYTNPVSGGDDRFSYQGQFYVAIVAPLSVAATTTIGRIRLHYVCEFFVPQLEGVDGSAAMVQPYDSSTSDFVNQDFLQFITNNGENSVIQGVQQWLPKLDSNGRYYINLAQGVYKLLRSIQATTNGGQTFTAGGTSTIHPTELIPNEPMPTSAPQPWVGQEQGSPASGYIDDIFSSVWLDELIGVPRGGAKLYGQFDLSGLTDVSGGLDFNMNLNRISNYISQPQSGVFMLFTGAETREPRRYLKEARLRAQNSFCARRVGRKAKMVLREHKCNDACVSPTSPSYTKPEDREKQSQPRNSTPSGVAADVLKRMISRGDSMEAMTKYVASLPINEILPQPPASEVNPRPPGLREVPSASLRKDNF